MSGSLQTPTWFEAATGRTERRLAQVRRARELGVPHCHVCGLDCPRGEPCRWRFA